MWLDRAPQYFRFKCNGLVFVGCVATKRPMLTSNSDTGHRCGSVFKQVKGGKLPDFAFLLLTFVSNEKTKWERQRHLGGFCDRALACPPASHPSVSLHTRLVQSHPTTPHEWTKPSCLILVIFFLQPGMAFFFTHPSRLSSHIPSLCRLRRCLHGTYHPTT